MSPRDYERILDEEKMREASRRFRRKQVTPWKEAAYALVMLAFLVGFVFAVFWQGSGRGSIF